MLRNYFIFSCIAIQLLFAVAAKSQMVSVFATNVSGTIGFDPAGNVYVTGFASTTVGKVTKYSPAGVILQTTTFPYDNNEMRPSYDALGNVYIADLPSRNVKKIATDGTVSTYGNNLNDPCSAAVDPAGNIYALLFWENKVVKINQNGSTTDFITNVSHDNNQAGSFIAFDGNGNLFHKDRYFIFKYPFGSTTGSMFLNGLDALTNNAPYNMSFDADGNMFTSFGNSKITKTTPGGATTLAFDGGAQNPVKVVKSSTVNSSGIIFGNPGAEGIGNMYSIQSQACSGNLSRLLVGSASGFATDPPTGNASQTYCLGSKVSDLQATGTSILWYAAASGGTALDPTTVLTNATHYFASQNPTGACESVDRLDVAVTITPLPAIALSSATNTDNQTLCPDIALTTIAYTVSNATGANVSGLPSGLTGSYSGGIFTISGTPSEPGTFSYTVTSSGGCAPDASAAGTITVNPAMVAGTCSADVVNDICQLNHGQIKLQVSGGTAPFAVAATSKTVAPSPTVGTISNVTAPSGAVDSGVTSYLFTGLGGNKEYKFKITDSKGCVVGSTH
ncbi:MAG: hypothetical protein ACOYOA_02725 [Saprospiraceae bacterium]